MRKYYTRACNFFYGSNSKKLVKKKLTLPLCGEDSISFNQIEIFIRDKRKVNSKIIDIKNINKLPLVIKKKISIDIKKIITKRKFLKNKDHLIMGVLNMTPDSFSDGGKFNSIKKANQRIKDMIKAGADIIDVGGESTRPGSKIISEKNELQRVRKTIEKFKQNFPKTLLSIDTRKSLVMNFSINNKADIINDVSCFKFDSKSFESIKKKKNMENNTSYARNTPKYAD